MIRTFDDLFEKIRLAGYDPRRMKGMYEEYLYWKEKYEEAHGTANQYKLAQLKMYRENLLGYLSCLQDIAYICQSEYDQLWNSLELPDIPEEGESHD